MGSVWVCCFPTCTTLPCRNCRTSPTHFLQPSTSISFRARASHNSGARTRRNRRVKSDAEIRNDIREFLASVGLPHDHIPSTKELLLHGWNDLANIVRRRGHKQIQEILTGSSLNVDFDKTSLDERLDAANASEDPLAGQNDNVESLVNDVEASTGFLLGNSSSSFYFGSSSSLDEGTNITEEASVSLIGEEEDSLSEVKDHTELVNDVTEGNFYPTEVIIADDDCDSSREGLYLNYGTQSSIMPIEISGELPHEVVYSGNSEYEDGLVGKTVGDVTLSSTENHSDTSFNDSDLDDAEDKEFSHSEPLIGFSEEQKDLGSLEALDDSNDYEDGLVGKIVGDITLSSTENQSDTSFNDSDLDDAEDKEFSHSEPLIGFPEEQKDLGSLEALDDSNDYIADDVATTSTSEISVRENVSGDNGVDSVVHYAYSSSINHDTLANLSLKEKVANFIQNGDLDPVEDHVSSISNGDDSQESKKYIESEPSGALDLDQPLWDDHLPHEDLTTHFDKDVDTEAPKMQNESEINHLKFMLYQKELELSRLKEQIEKEKLALSVLQSKAEEEISKAKKLISEKDAELNVAEESLTGLKEVEVEYCGDGDVVEVAGSFNGWYHRIKMDPQLSTSDIDLGGSRRSRCWTAILWLYPGVYEIKFVVDGKWVTDPQMESVSRGHICNNILRVDR